ncbi:hypothetical protein IEQ34_008621 [Dendrobium chrysotoxum]|uniref:Bulb-type lectin domain-containing protein n=1 Tax=Dendrobium chrysotoxum TaxID=161865 RepID=A0AAV7GY99_DENCH|nr:hypothetical protein IEQ34_008621 [Dendrobium chrysotoxum]
MAMMMISTVNIPTRSFASISIVCVATLLLIFAPSYSNCSASSMQVGDILNTGDSLILGGCALTMQTNCDLVLFISGSSIWDSNTSGKGDGQCQLKLNNDGQLAILSGGGNIVWTSPYQGSNSNYVLQFNGECDVEIRDLSRGQTVCSNTMNSGDKLFTSESLGLGYCGFTMQSDCNLVLYVLGGSVWATNTYGRGDHCQLELTRNGQLVISNNGAPVWTSSFQGEDDNYVLKLQGDGNVVISNSNENSVCMQVGDILYTGDSLVLGGCALTMGTDCDLVIYTSGSSIWDSKTSGKGHDCQAKLNNDGQLVISSDTSNTVWGSSFQGPNSNYVLEFTGLCYVGIRDLNNGQTVWSTCPIDLCINQ